MSLILHRHTPIRSHPLFPFLRAMDEMMNYDSAPYLNSDDDSLSFGNIVQDVTNNEQKFSLSLDVSHFRPEELKVNLEGRTLTIQGTQEKKERGSYMQRSFTRSWTLPEDADVNAIQSSLSDKGHLQIEAPKSGQPVSRSIPIMHAPKA